MKLPSLFQSIRFNPIEWLNAKVEIEIVAGEYKDENNGTRTGLVKSVKGGQIIYTTLVGFSVDADETNITLYVAAPIQIEPQGSREIKAISLDIDEDGTVLAQCISAAEEFCPFGSSIYYVKVILTNLETGQKFGVGN